MTLFDLINAYTSGDEEERFRKRKAFKNLLRSIDNPNGLPALCDLLEAVVDDRYPSPETFSLALAYVGINRNTDIDTFIKFFSDAGRLGLKFNKIGKPISSLYVKFKDNLEEISNTDLRNYLEAWPLYRPGINVRFSDAKYLLPTKACFMEILSYYHSYELMYIRERRDCDDFALMFRAFLSRHAVGNLTVAIIWARFETEQGVKFGHAVNLAIVKNDEGNIEYLIYEPQQKDIFYTLDVPAREVEMKKIDPWFVLF